ncbi:PIN domain-containing protein [Sandaracinobacteroides hominis]|uniref:PIN domain-containing protein n=1 Tax=Sandaracinobacteroides hominis TaxID=2780086 RepID=UPI0018F46B40|nr:PIN domain-containing protein [Sandaracinobacteroides hominis]
MSGFLDTNILVYCYAESPRKTVARTLLDGRNRIGVQTLNEFSLVARRRMGYSWAELNEAIEHILSLVLRPLPLTYETHRDGLRIAERYQLGIYDSIHLAAALTANCRSFWSEDLHDGLVIDGRLTIRNPFV